MFGRACSNLMWQPPSARDVPRNFVLAQGARIPVAVISSDDFFPAVDDFVHVNLLYSHGNAQDLGSARPFIERLVRYALPMDLDGMRIRYRAVAWDYPGYGGSTEKCDAVKTEAWALEVAAYAFDGEEANPASALAAVNMCLGYSLGCAPSVHVAAQSDSVHAVLLAAPFSRPIDAPGSALLKAACYLTGVVMPFDVAANLPAISALCVAYQSDADGVVNYAANSAPFLARSRQGGFVHKRIEGVRHTYFCSDDFVEQHLVPDIRMLLLRLGTRHARGAATRKHEPGDGDRGVSAQGAEPRAGG